MCGDCSAKFVSDIIILSVHKLYDYDIADIGECEGSGEGGESCKASSKCNSTAK